MKFRQTLPELSVGTGRHVLFPLGSFYRLFKHIKRLVFSGRTPTDTARGIMQIQPAVTPPLCKYARCLPATPSRPGRILRRLASEYIANGWELFRHRNDYQTIITSDYRTALVFGA